MLTTVQNQQGSTVPEELPHRIQRRPVDQMVNAQRLRDGVGDQGVVTDLGQLDQPGTVRQAAPQTRRRPQRKPRLADARGTGQGHQPRGRYQPLDLGQFAAWTSFVHCIGPAGGPRHSLARARYGR